MSVIKACIDRFRQQEPLPRELRDRSISKDAFWWRSFEKDKDDIDISAGSEGRERQSSVEEEGEGAGELTSAEMDEYEIDASPSPLPLHRLVKPTAQTQIYVSQVTHCL